jgi:hypothetical protein
LFYPKHFDEILGYISILFTFSECISNFSCAFLCD